MAPNLCEDTAPWPTPAFPEAWAAPVHSGAQPWQVWGLARRQQARPRPLPKRRFRAFNQVEEREMAVALLQAELAGCESRLAATELSLLRKAEEVVQLSKVVWARELTIDTLRLRLRNSEEAHARTVAELSVALSRAWALQKDLHRLRSRPLPSLLLFGVRRDAKAAWRWLRARSKTFLRTGGGGSSSAGRVRWQWMCNARESKL